MIKVEVRDKRWWFNGVEVSPRIQTSFKWFGYVWGPHRDRGKARAWLERLKELGFHGGRFFLETHGWAESDHPFWSLPPHNVPWDLNQPVTSKFALSNEQKEGLAWAVGQHVDLGLVSEFCINATIKSSPGPLSRDDARCATYWERMQRVTLQYLKSIGATNLWFENTNEFNAHVNPGVAMRIDQVLEAMARRARQEDYPGVPYGISTGGTWELPYHASQSDPWSYTHINIHTPRSGYWEAVTGDINRLFMKYDCSVFLNENNFYMDQDQWDYWVEAGHWGNKAKLAAQSTTNKAKIMQQMLSTLEMGAGYCVHNLNGAATDPDAQPDEVELEVQRRWGEPVAPPSPPELRFDHIIRRAYEEVLQRPADPDGLAAYNQAMRNGLQEYQLRSMLMWSNEYRERFTK